MAPRRAASCSSAAAHSCSISTARSAAHGTAVAPCPTRPPTSLHPLPSAPARAAGISADEQVAGEICGSAAIAARPLAKPSSEAALSTIPRSVSTICACRVLAGRPTLLDALMRNNKAKAEPASACSHTENHSYLPQFYRYGTQDLQARFSLHIRVLFRVHLQPNPT